MHQKERYEEIITGKLAALPLPDMADAIWARIERQLDIDMPTDDGGNVPESSSPRGGGIVAGAGLLAFIGALLTFFYFQPTQKQNTKNPSVQTQQVTPANTNATSNQPAVGRQTVPQIKKTVDTGTSVPFTTAPGASSGDLSLANPQPDSTAEATAQDVTAQAASNGVQPPPLPEAKRDSMPKKRRGVQGIGDKDYRIEPKRN